MDLDPRQKNIFIKIQKKTGFSFQNGPNLEFCIECPHWKLIYNQVYVQREANLDIISTKNILTLPVVSNLGTFSKMFQLLFEGANTLDTYTVCVRVCVYRLQKSWYA